MGHVQPLEATAAAIADLCLLLIGGRAFGSGDYRSDC